MDKRQYYLQKIAEEALEVATAAMKCIQFGNDCIDPNQLPYGKNNQQSLEYELNDLIGAVFAARSEGYICKDFDREAISEKQDKIDHYYQICKGLGTVKED